MVKVESVHALQTELGQIIENVGTVVERNKLTAAVLEVSTWWTDHSPILLAYLVIPQDKPEAALQTDQIGIERLAIPGDTGPVIINKSIPASQTLDEVTSGLDTVVRQAQAIDQLVF